MKLCVKRMKIQHNCDCDKSKIQNGLKCRKPEDLFFFENNIFRPETPFLKNFERRKDPFFLKREGGSVKLIVSLPKISFRGTVCIRNTTLTHIYTLYFFNIKKTVYLSVSHSFLYDLKTFRLEPRHKIKSHSSA